jgi:malate dehydrogenase (oxaloacetate-decarboxylating)(NADP+)
MKMAAAIALAKLAKLEVPPEVLKAYSGKEMKFGRDYIIPSPFDPRLIDIVPVEVAKAAIESGVAKVIITDWEAYKF